MDDNMKVKKALSMFVDLFGLERHSDPKLKSRLEIQLFPVTKYPIKKLDIIFHEFSRIV